MTYCVTWDDDAAVVDRSREVLFASSDDARRRVEVALRDPVIVWSTGDANETLRPGDPGFIPAALKRLSPCTITGED